MYFSVVYLGEHYVVDVVAGILYAVLADTLMINIRRFSHYLDNNQERKAAGEVEKIMYVKS